MSDAPRPTPRAGCASCGRPREEHPVIHMSALAGGSWSCSFFHETPIQWPAAYVPPASAPAATPGNDAAPPTVDPKSTTDGAPSPSSPSCRGRDLAGLGRPDVTRNIAPAVPTGEAAETKLTEADREVLHRLAELHPEHSVRLRAIAYHYPMVRKMVEDSASDLAAQATTLAALRAREAVPGEWHCDRCGFHLSTRTLSAVTMEVGVRALADDPRCPNDGDPLRSWTWREQCEAMAEAREFVDARLLELSNEVEYLRAALASPATTETR